MFNDIVPSARKHVVALEPGDGRAVAFVRENGEVFREELPFRPFILLTADSLLHGFSPEHTLTTLHGDAMFRFLAEFPSPAVFEEARKFLRAVTGVTAGSPASPYRVITDLTQQAMMRLDLRLFADMRFEDVRRMQLDIETVRAPEYDFSNPERESDAIVLIALRDSTGWEQIISCRDMSEKEMLEAFVRLVRERDPDILEGHNLFRFDLPYIETRAKRFKVKLALGRDGSPLKKRNSRFSAAERTVNYTRYEAYGRHIADTYHLSILYDAVKRDLDGYSLKTIAKHFRVARPDRVYVDASDMARLIREEPGRAAEYCLDDVRETDAISQILSPAFFYQTQIIPLSYQNCIVRGNATRIDGLFTAEYLRAGESLPAGERARPFAGALTKAFADGVYRNVSHCDVRSLYPSVILSRQWAPSQDSLGVFLRLLDKLRTFRLAAKDAMRAETDPARKNYYSSLQSTFKILINSFYGYLGFEQGFLNDFDAAERVTAEGRRILETMFRVLQENGANVIEMDTDGIYFQPPASGGETLPQKLAQCLPRGIDVDFDESYPAMFSYKSKNYALLKKNGELAVSGAALKSRGLEPFQRTWMRRMILAILHEDRAAADELNREYETALREHRFPLADLAKTETLADSPESYRKKMGSPSARRSAAYELALASGREYRQGDQISFYVTGTKKKVSVTDNAKRLADADESVRDENVEYYLDKLSELRKKFEPFLPPADAGAQQGEFKLDF